MPDEMSVPAVSFLGEPTFPCVRIALSRGCEVNGTACESILKYGFRTLELIDVCEVKLLAM